MRDATAPGVESPFLLQAGRTRSSGNIRNQAMLRRPPLAWRCSDKEAALRDRHAVRSRVDRITLVELAGFERPQRQLIVAGRKRTTVLAG